MAMDEISILGKIKHITPIFSPMTVITKDDIPSQINTLERLAMWAIMALRRTNPTLAVVERANDLPENVAQTAIFQASDDSIRFFGRVSVELDGDYAEDNTTKLWIKAKEFSNVVLPEQYKQD